LPRSLSTSQAKADRPGMPRKMKFREFETTVSGFGNGCHVIVPKDWKDKKVKVVLIEDEEK